MSTLDFFSRRAGILWTKGTIICESYRKQKTWKRLAMHLHVCWQGEEHHEVEKTPQKREVLGIKIFLT